MEAFDISILVTLLVATLAMVGFGSVLIFLLQKQIKSDFETKEEIEAFLIKEEKVVKELFNLAKNMDKNFEDTTKKVDVVGNDILKHTGKEDGR